MKTIYSIAIAIVLSLVALPFASQGSVNGAHPVLSPDTQVVAMNFTAPVVRENGLLPAMASTSLGEVGGVLTRLMGVFNKMSVDGALHNGIAKVVVVGAPEPGTYAIMGSFLVLGLLVARRSRKARV